MAAFSTFLRFLKWKMDGKWKMENANRIHHPGVLLGSRGEVRQVCPSEESAYPTLPTSVIHPQLRIQPGEPASGN